MKTWRFAIGLADPIGRLGQIVQRSYRARGAQVGGARRSALHLHRGAARGYRLDGALVASGRSVEPDRSGTTGGISGKSGFGRTANIRFWHSADILRALGHPVFDVRPTSGKTAIRRLSLPPVPIDWRCGKRTFVGPRGACEQQEKLTCVSAYTPRTAEGAASSMTNFRAVPDQNRSPC